MELSLSRSRERVLIWLLQESGFARGLLIAISVICLGLILIGGIFKNLS